MVLASSHELFAATAATAGALTGLLFVAISVSAHGRTSTAPPVIRQVRAAAALLAFTNALAVSLFSLVPDTNAGYPAAVTGVIGLLFTAASIRSVRSSRATRPQKFSQFELMGLLLLILGAELASGVALIADPRSDVALEIIGYAIVSLLLVGVARAWELVGDRDTGIRASIAVLTHHEQDFDDPAGADNADLALGGTPGPPRTDESPTE